MKRSSLNSEYEEFDMGLVRVALRLSNVAKPGLEEIDADALVDTGALHLCIPRHIANQLQLSTLKPREVTLADGSRHMIDYVAPVRVAFGNRECVTGALVMGNEVLLGAIPMEDMDVIVHPAKQMVVVNPENPNFAGSVVMGHRTHP
jgi:clan AA aspartic protease